jgi:hypothetical protein
MKRWPASAGGICHPLGKAAGALVLLLAGTHASYAACVLWDMSGHWAFHQSNGVSTSFDLKQTRSGEISGTAESSQFAGGGLLGPNFEWNTLDTGTVTGSTNGNSFSWIVTWKSGAKGEYVGTIRDVDGTVVGEETRDLNNRGITAKLQGASARTQAPCMIAAAPKPANPNYQVGTDMPGNDYRGFDTIAGDAECSVACSKEHKCQAWTWSKQIKRCWLKNAVPVAILNDCCISGVKSKVIFAPGKVLKAIGPAKVDHDVEIFDSPVEPRKVIGMMLAGAQGRAMQHHGDGWCRLEAIDRTDPPSVKAGWVADDHFTKGKCPMQ